MAKTRSAFMDVHSDFTRSLPFEKSLSGSSVTFPASHNGPQGNMEIIMFMVSYCVFYLQTIMFIFSYCILDHGSVNVLGSVQLKTYFNVHIQSKPVMGAHSSYQLGCLSRTDG